MLLKRLFSKAITSNSPPHPISNIRPLTVLESHSKYLPTSDQLGQERLQLKLEEQRLNSFNHGFWLDVGVYMIYNGHAA